MVVSFFSSKVSNLKSVIGRDKTLSELANKITVTTYHSAKGLEKKAVIIHDFDKLFYNVKNKQEERMRRSLGFVAITRAEDELYFLGNPKEGALKELVEVYKELQLLTLTHNISN